MQKSFSILLVAAVIVVCSASTFASTNPKNFDDVNQLFQSLYPSDVDHIVNRAFGGTCYYSTVKTFGYEGYIGGIILGKDTDNGIFEKKVGTVYRLSGNKKYTKGDIFSTLFGWWSRLSPITVQSPLIVDNKTNPDIDEVREGNNVFISQSKLKMDLDCKYVNTELLPLCVNGFIPKGTHYKSCFYFEELQ